VHKHTSGPPARRRAGRPRALTSVAVVGTLVAVVLLCAAAGIVWLQHHADERRSSQLALADLELGITELWLLVGNAAAVGSLSAEISDEAQLLGARIDRTIAAAARTFPGDAKMASTLDAAQLLRETMRTELGLVAAGSLEEAAGLDRDQVEPTYRGFKRKIDATRAAAGKTAEDAVSLASAGALGVLVAAGGILILLLLRFRTASRRAREAHYDPLTGLANRMLFAERLDAALADRRGGSMAVLFLDLDDFKLVNDSLGHAAGDRLLLETAERVFGVARTTDTVARLGGDEFAFLLENTGREGAQAFAERVKRAVRQPFAVDGRALTVDATIGFATGRPGEADPGELLRNADLAMYAGKHQGKGVIVAYEPTMYQALADRLELEEDLRGALGRGELSLVYQPIVEVDGGALTAVEALARWSHPVRGEIPPTVFIPIAEESGSIREIGRWVLLEACAQARRWHDARSGGTAIGVTVNVSPAQFLQDELVDDVRTALERSGLDSSKLTLEITESVLVERGDAFVGELEALSELGVRIAVDDFGTGYSSLSSLARFPVDMLKIDQSFVADAARDDESWALVRSIVQLGESLGLVSVAEGIEGQGQADALQGAGCSLAQGFHFAEPLDATAVEALIGGIRTPEPATRLLEPHLGLPAIRPPRAA